MAVVPGQAATQVPGRRLTGAIARLEPWLLLPAALPLVLRERFPPWLQVAALLWIAALVAVRFLARGRPSVATAMDVPVLCLLLTLPGAVHAALDRAAALSRVESLLFALALAYALANAVDTPRRLWSVVTWLQVAGLGLGLVALVSVDWQAKFPLLEPVLGRLPRVVTVVPHPTLQAPAVHPNSVAALLVLFVPLSLACLLWPAGDRPAREGVAWERPRWIRPLAALCLAALVPLLVLTQSRGAWLAVLAALAVMAAIRSRPLAGVLAGVALTVGVVGASAALLAGPSGALLEPASRTAASRVELWRGSLDLLAARPDTGIGLNTFPLVYGQRPEYEGRYIYHGYAHAHNTLLQAAMDYGVPGFGAVVGLYAAVALAARRAHRRLAGTPLDAVVVGLAAGLAAHAAHGMFDALAIGAKPGFLPWAFAGTLVGARHYAHRWAPRATRGSAQR